MKKIDSDYVLSKAEEYIKDRGDIPSYDDYTIDIIKDAFLAASQML